MKSAYELAMERLQQDDPSAPPSLSDAQKAELADVEAKFRARKAEREIFLQKQILDARRKGERTELAMLEQQLRNERTRLDEECEAAKNKIRHASPT